MPKLHSTLVDGLARKRRGKWRRMALFSNAKAPFRDALMRCNQRLGNALRTNCRSSQSAIWQNQRHIGPYACVRNRTATTAQCFEPLHLSGAEPDQPPQPMQPPRFRHPSMRHHHVKCAHKCVSPQSSVIASAPCRDWTCACRYFLGRSASRPNRLGCLHLRMSLLCRGGSYRRE